MNRYRQLKLKRYEAQRKQARAAQARRRRMARRYDRLALRDSLAPFCLLLAIMWLAGMAGVMVLTAH